MRYGQAGSLGLVAVATICGAQAGATREHNPPPVPNGWTVDARAEGDLNSDGASDAVLVIRKVDPKLVRPNEGLGESRIDTNPRRLVVYVKSGEGYRRLTSADDFVPPAGSKDSPCLADPLAEGGISISRQVLTVKLHYWLSCGGWGVTSNSYQFRLESAGFRLIGFDQMAFMRSSGEGTETSVNFLTKRKSVTPFAIDDSIPKKLRWSRIKPQRIYLETFSLEDCRKIDNSTSLC